MSAATWASTRPLAKAPSDPEVEARQVLQSVDQTLKEAGLTMDDLVYVEIYCPDLNLYSTPFQHVILSA